MPPAKKAASKKAPTGKARVTKEVLEIDLSGVSARERRVKRVIPEGVYRAKVHEVGPAKFSTGKRGITWVLEVTDEGPGKGARFWHNNVFIDEDGSIMTDSLWTVRGTLQALEPKVKIPEKLSKFPFSRLLNRTVAIEVADGDYDGKPRSELLDVFHPDLIEEEEDEEIEETEEDEDWDEEESDDEEDEEEEDEEEEDEDEFDLDEDEL